MLPSALLDLRGAEHSLGESAFPVVKSGCGLANSLEEWQP